MWCKIPVFCGMLFISVFGNAFAERGVFDLERWDNVLEKIRTTATNQNISKSVIDETLKSPAFIPGIVKSDRKQTEFTLTLEQYLNRTVSNERVKNGRKKRAEYPTLLSRVEQKYGVPRNVTLAFWGMESNYGAVKSKHQLTSAFITLIYEGRREEFFSKQLLALMKIADKNKLSINDIHGSWAGAMGHFQFIPTTLTQYGVDGNADGRIDIINSIGDAMMSAGNYLNKLGWNKNEPIIYRVTLPADFDRVILNGDTKKSFKEWAQMGVMNLDGTPLPQRDTVVGLIADTKAIAERDLYQPQRNEDGQSMDSDVAPSPVIKAYLTYPNFYRIKKWNNSSWYAIAIGELADKLK
ncbi:MAG: lytic murein transglycosylase [Alphaproteobacteria bacterium]|nr:lytic murein transglycosylase [Alphaproteobacteria bacterium]